MKYINKDEFNKEVKPAIADLLSTNDIQAQKDTNNKDYSQSRQRNLKVNKWINLKIY